MTVIRFPWHVNVDGTIYAPGDLIKVEDAAEYIKEGAEIVQTTNENETDKTPEKPAPARRGRRRLGE